MVGPRIVGRMLLLVVFLFLPVVVLFGVQAGQASSVVEEGDEKTEQQEESSPEIKYSDDFSERRLRGLKGLRESMPGRRAPGRRRVKQSLPDLSTLDAPSKAVLTNEMHARLSTVARSQSFRGGAPLGGIWMRDALGTDEAMPLTTHFERGVLRTMNLKDGSMVWLASGNVDEPAAVLRLGDLLPLLNIIGINDRQLALSVTEIVFGGGSVPPAYTMVFRAGALWPHRHALQAAERSGRIHYSLATGRLTVLGALVVANADGDMSVRFTSHEGDNRDRYMDLIMPTRCAPLEEALRGRDPQKALPRALELLREPSVVQTCGAGYLASAKPDTAADEIRRVMTTSRVSQPRELIDALLTIEPDLSETNMEALTVLANKTGTIGANALCGALPVYWSRQILQREDLSEPNKRVLMRCLRR